MKDYGSEQLPTNITEKPWDAKDQHGKSLAGKAAETAALPYPFPGTFRRIFQIGHQKTATRSVAAAVGFLFPGIRMIHGFPSSPMNLRATVRIGRKMWKNVPHPKDEYISKVIMRRADISWLEHYDYLGEHMHLIWRQLDRQWPGSRFILCVRPTDSWTSSVKKTQGRNKYRRMMRKFYSAHSIDQTAPIERLVTYGAMIYTDEWPIIFERHNEQVIDYFKGRDDLLVFNAFTGDSWRELSDFLECEPPEISFPNIKNLSGKGVPKCISAMNRNNTPI